MSDKEPNESEHVTNVGSVENGLTEVWCSCGTVLAVGPTFTLDELATLAHDRNSVSP